MSARVHVAAVKRRHERRRSVVRPKAPVGKPKQDPETVDRRARLISLRDILEAAVNEAAHRDLAPLAARYQSVLAEIAALPAGEAADDIDDLASARARRRESAASGL
jgi:hypothetical protein